MTEAEWLACNDTVALLGSVLERVNDRKLLLLATAHHFTWRHANEAMRARLEQATVYSEVLRRYIEIWNLALADEGVRARFECVARYIEGDATRNEVRKHWLADASSNDVSHPEDPFGWVSGIAHNCSYFGDAVGAWPPSEFANFLRDIFGNPFRPAAFDPAWRTSTAVALAGQMYESRDFGAMPILADALQDAGCDNEEVLDHCRGEEPHVRGCWVVDLVLSKG